MSLWMSSITPLPWVFLSFLYTLYIQISGNSSEVVIVLSIFVSWIATTCGWWASRKAKCSSILPLIPLIFILQNFNPLTKLGLVVSGVGDLYLLPEKKILKGFYHTGLWRPSWSCDLDLMNKHLFPHPKDVPHIIWFLSSQQFPSRYLLKEVNKTKSEPSRTKVSKWPWTLVSIKVHLADCINQLLCHRLK